MKKQPICTIVNFCSNESRFIKACLEQAFCFSSQVIIPVCDHFFDGAPENLSLLKKIYAAFPECLFVEYPYIPKKMPNKIWKKIEPAHFWHSLSRLVGYSFLDSNIESVLFLDADEIPDGSRFAAWLNDHEYMHYDALKFSNFWYFREPCNQALTLEDSIVLAKKKALRPKSILSQEERDAIYNLALGPKKRNVKGLDSEPMFHHYSWVRTKEEMEKKVKAWGHKGDRDWRARIQEEFAGPFRGIDFVHGYKYRTVKPLFYFDKVQFEPKGIANVRRIEEKELIALLEKNLNAKAQGLQFLKKLFCRPPKKEKELDF